MKRHAVFVDLEAPVWTYELISAVFLVEILTE